MKPSTSKNVSRRHFLKAAGAAVILPAILPGCAIGRNGKKNSANGKINMGVVGWGMQGPSNTKSFMFEQDCRVVAACDLDKNALQTAVNTINDNYENKDCAAYHDYREMFARPDLDAVMLAVPDHWHAMLATEDEARTMRQPQRRHTFATLGRAQTPVTNASHYTSIILEV